MSSWARSPFAGQLQHSADLPCLLSTGFLCQLERQAVAALSLPLRAQPLLVGQAGCIAWPDFTFDYHI